MKNKKTMFVVFAAVGLFLSASAYGQSSSSQNAAKPSLCVNGIIFEEGNPLAIINGDYYKEGDIVEGAEIIGITESAVTARFAGSSFTNALGEGCDGARKVTTAIEETIEQANRQFKSSLGASKGSGPLPVKFSRYDIKKLDSGLLAGSVVSLVILLLVLAVFYIYFALTLQIVARKTGTSHGWLAWLPIGNFVLMAMIAKRPLW
jgi:hypothetical protein